MFYKLIYNLDLVAPKTLNTYIEINLVNSFIQSFTSFIKALIVFFKKLDNNF